ncbi:peptidyl-prolyl cis-trans isomerase [Litoribacter alkaliphilus]|uniref:Peptidyl-prolyl cis-trans isomerase n=1 Tax=Litoribacter ruber TaxID=702568 RepID=A0AAP2CID8_9BACT|nr:peptidyl-prolyl cis-trans isomerase [Litoribacter alkaliphilus]MBS9524234.1 peptidyl-prolyl cis-trans isomerase [Litoribacter alkaliphilus]
MKKKKNVYLRLLKSKVYLLILAGALSSCENTGKRIGRDADDRLVASVGSQRLFSSDLEFLSAKITPGEDSAKFAERYVQNWIRKQLMVQQAEKNKSIDPAELERKLLDYKYALMVYEYEKDYVDQNLDKDVPYEEISAYYNQNRENFILKEIISRVNFFKLEKQLPQNKDLERLLKSNRDNSKEIRELAQRYASNFFLEDSTWVKFDEVTQNTPLAGHPNKVQLLKSNDFYKVEDEEFAYYFKILEFKLADQVPPMDFVRDEIAKIILNKRKVSLADQLHKDIYSRALEKNEFTIHD